MSDSTGNSDSINVSDSTGDIQLDPNGNLTVSDGAGNMIASPPTFVGTSITFSGLSAEEREELENLKKQRQLDIKRLQREKFKELPIHVRERVVEEIEVRRLVREIESAESKIPKSNRQTELENRDMPSFLSVNTDFMFTVDNFVGRLLKVFTDAEIIEMHNDIEAEKALLED